MSEFFAFVAVVVVVVVVENPGFYPQPQTRLLLLLPLLRYVESVENVEKKNFSDFHICWRARRALPLQKLGFLWLHLPDEAYDGMRIDNDSHTAANAADSADAEPAFSAESAMRRGRRRDSRRTVFCPHTPPTVDASHRDQRTQKSLILF